MNQEPKSTKWHIGYNLLAKALFEFYTNCKKSDKQPGNELYELLSNNTDFKNSNTWIDKFKKEFGVKSLDPIHVFASFNGSKSSDVIRKKKFILLLRLLKVKHNIQEINFDGCPTPMVINVLSARNHDDQIQIWDLFQRAYQKGRKGIEESDFKNFKNWYGIEFGIFTIFLFWIRSDSFLPIDQNTRTYLIASRIIQSEPKDFHSYMYIIEKVNKYNYENNELFGSQGIFREIAQTSFNTINKGIQTNGNTIQFNELKKSSILPKKRILTKDQISKSENQQIVPQKLIASTSSQGFKIIAIRPLTGCKPEYLNVLESGKFYYFEKAYDIKENIIEYDPKKTISLYDLSTGQRNKLKVNVTAIVGKNGCGKSSLLELFFRIINNITYTFKREIHTNDLILQVGLVAEFYYINYGKIYCICVNDEHIQIQSFEYDGVSFLKTDKNSREFVKNDFNNLFYTVAVNYSHHALNSKILGQWVQALFHKNDSYQTPLVINPMRTEGIIDINVENDLVKSRLMANLFAPIEEDGDLGIRQMTEYQQAIKINFNRILNKNKFLIRQQDGILFTQLRTDKTLILKLVYNIFGISRENTEGTSVTVLETEAYIIRKLVKISITYSHYSKYFNVKRLVFIKSKLEEYLGLLKDDTSHITYKLKQAINYLKYPNLLSRVDSFVLDINEYSKKLENFIAIEEDIDIIELLPPPIFNASIRLLDNKKAESDFEKLSSGEKQLIHSTSSILYHIKYIDSVSSDNEELVGYRNINLLLDEIEMYYHPEMQRKYLSYLLRMIRKLSLIKIEAINICLVTHSPYILSDIPDFYTLRLEKGKPKPEDGRTFGANIHDLLANDFFMNDGFMGEWAKQKIEEIILFLNFSMMKVEFQEMSTEGKIQDNKQYKQRKKALEKKLIEIYNQIKKNKTLDEKIDIEKVLDEREFNKLEYKQIIDLIGEPIIRIKLTAMYNDVFEDKEELKRMRFEQLAQELGATINYI